MIMPSPIFVLGAARSGLAMTARIIEAAGAWGGICWGSNRAEMNNREIQTSLIEPYLRLCGADPKGQWPLPDGGSLLTVGNLKQRMEHLMVGQGYMRQKEGTQWFLKDHRLALLWPAFHEAFPGARWVLVRRERDAVVNSCMNTTYMNRIHTEDGWCWWYDFYRARLDEIQQQSWLDSYEVWPTKYVDGDTAEIHGVIDGLGLNWCDDLPAYAIGGRHGC